jgi:hypothetical protein
MATTRIFSVAFIVAGIVLLIFGIDAWNSVGSDITRAFEGGPSNRAIWLVISGAIAFFLGIGGLFYTPRTRIQ